jgi:hypothetical protein
LDPGVVTDGVHARKEPGLPYRRAYLWVGAMVPLILLAFWPAYFGKLGEAPWAFHVHGITASLWVALLIAQSWAIHHRRRDVHVLAGKTMLVLIPAFLAGGFAIVAREVNETNPFMMIYRDPLAASDTITVVTFAVLGWAGLRARRQVQLHARYLLATVLFLIMPIATRIFSNHTPGLTLNGPEDYWRYGLSVQISFLIAFAIALRLYLANRRHGLPYLVAMSSLVLQSFAFSFIARTETWMGLMRVYGMLPSTVHIGVGLVVGLVVVVLGWIRAPARLRPPEPVPS